MVVVAAVLMMPLRSDLEIPGLNHIEFLKAS
jgi:hypothetical protein